MFIVKPQEVTASTLDSSNVVESVIDWVAGAYTASDQVIFNGYLYEALSSTSDQPDIGAAKSSPTWLKSGITNRWRMFRDGSSVKTINPDLIDVTMTMPLAVSAIAILQMRGASVQITVEPPLGWVAP